MDYLMLVDRFNPVPTDFADTLELYEVRGVLMEKQAGAALEKMLAAAAADMLKIKAISGYRSFDYQQLLWERSVSHEMSAGLSYGQAVEKTARTLAIPGASEHNIGLAADLATEDADDTQDDFHLTAQGRWLWKNAADYGFILRYPRMKEHLTGIDFEPWHYRYVGCEAAKLISGSGICLEEFLHFYSDKYIVR